MRFLFIIKRFGKYIFEILIISECLSDHYWPAIFECLKRFLNDNLASPLKFLHFQISFFLFLVQLFRDRDRDSVHFRRELPRWQGYRLQVSQKICHLISTCQI